MRARHAVRSLYSRSVGRASSSRKRARSIYIDILLYVSRYTQGALAVTRALDSPHLAARMMHFSAVSAQTYVAYIKPNRLLHSYVRTATYARSLNTTALSFFFLN